MNQQVFHQVKLKKTTTEHYIKIPAIVGPRPNNEPRLSKPILRPLNYNAHVGIPNNGTSNVQILSKLLYALRLTLFAPLFTSLAILHLRSSRPQCCPHPGPPYARLDSGPCTVRVRRSSLTRDRITCRLHMGFNYRIVCDRIVELFKPEAHT